MGSEHSHIIEGIEASARNGLFSVSFDFSGASKEHTTSTINYLYKQGYNFKRDGHDLIVNWDHAFSRHAKKMYELASKNFITLLCSKLNDTAALGTLTATGFVSDYIKPSNFNFVARLKKEGIDCTFDNKKVTYNWRYSTTGKGLNMRRTAEQVLWDKVMSVLNVEFASKTPGMSYAMPHSLNPEQLKTLQTKYFIEYRNNAFVFTGNQSPSPPTQHEGEKDHIKEEENHIHTSPSAPDAEPRPDGTGDSKRRPDEPEHTNRVMVGESD